MKYKIRVHAIFFYHACSSKASLPFQKLLSYLLVYKYVVNICVFIVMIVISVCLSVCHSVSRITEK